MNGYIILLACFIFVYAGIRSFKFLFFRKRYAQRLTEAYAFTKDKFGEKLNLSDIVIPIKEYDIQSMNVLLSAIIDYLNSKDLDEIAFNCSIVCIDIQNLLKEKFDVNAIVTSGYITRNNRKRYYVNRAEIIFQFGKSKMYLKHHVWLTVGAYIVDPTLMASIFTINPDAFSINTFQKNGVIFYKHKDEKIRIENDSYGYMPLFVGKQYYAQTSYCSRLFVTALDH